MLVPCGLRRYRSPLPLRGAFGRGCSRCALVTISSPGDTALAKASWPSLAEIIQSRTPRSVVRSSDPQILFDYKILEGAESLDSAVFNESEYCRCAGWQKRWCLLVR